MTPDHHWGYMEPLPHKMARPETRQQIWRWGLVLAPRFLPVCPQESHSPSLVPNSGICETHDSHQLFIKSLPPCVSLERFYSEAMRKVAHCTSLMPMTISTKTNPFNLTEVQWDSKRCCFPVTLLRNSAGVPTNSPTSWLLCIASDLFAPVFLPMQVLFFF